MDKIFAHDNWLQDMKESDEVTMYLKQCLLTVGGYLEECQPRRKCP